MNLYWTGARGSDTCYTGGLFVGSITIYGNGERGNLSYCYDGNERINHNIESPEASAFILERQLKMISNDPSVQFMAYNPNYVYGAPKEVLERTLCLNEPSLMHLIDNKLSFRRMASPIVPMSEYQVLSREDIIQTIFPALRENNQFVIQAPISSGGEGTFLLNLPNHLEIAALLDTETNYIVTKYVENNIPVNIHCVIYEDSCVILPPSIQLIVSENNRLLYRGADYITYSQIAGGQKKTFQQYVEELCKHIAALGYRGISGFDALITPQDIFIVEANNRFQGSSYALNKALWECGLPSLQQMNLEAFGETVRTVSVESTEQFIKLKVPYSYFIFTNEDGGAHARLVSERACVSPEVCENSKDGFRPEQQAAIDAYLYHLLFSTNISVIDSVCFSLQIHPALLATNTNLGEEFFMASNLSKLKIALTNQGIYVEKTAARYLSWEKGVKLDQCIMLDLLLNQKVYVNCPTAIKFARISPFALHFTANELSLHYYDKKLPFAVEYLAKPVLPVLATSSGSPLCDIAFFSTDRLRLQNSPTCIFNKENMACKFCEVCEWDLTFTEKDVLETINVCFQTELRFRHILIGGRSHAIGTEKDTLLRMCERVRRYSEIPIYLMCLPPKNCNDIKLYVDSGITEFGFNIEIFDRNIAAQIMPGKGKIPLQQYLDALEYATMLCGKSGAVRSAFVVGLEPRESLLAGVEAVSRIGVAPILSAFRPIPRTPMQDCIPLSSEQLCSLAEEAATIAAKYGMRLGPECIACQNNTLNI